jgi:FkbM family methyltransferase
MAYPTIVRLRRVLRRAGLDVIRPVPTFVDLIHKLGADAVLDVGANEGQYGTYLRDWGYRGQIVSFEPISSAFSRLSARAASDAHWATRNEALGASDERSTINVSNLSVFSSLLVPNEVVKNFDPRAATARKEEVQVRRLDSIWQDIQGYGRKFYLKVDTQGFEPQVVRGAESALSSITAVQLELSLSAHYEGELLLAEMIKFMSERAFDLRFVKPVQYDQRDLSIPQLDCVFVNRAAR